MPVLVAAGKSRFAVRPGRLEGNISGNMVVS
jgi:hypothetical protein